MLSPPQSLEAMASTVRDDEDKEELFDPTDVLDLKATQMAEWIRESRHMIAFTVSS